MTDIAVSFDADRRKLAAACERVAAATQHPGFSLPSVSEPIRKVAAMLNASCRWEEQAAAAASLRSFFHRDGINDVPGPIDCPSWETDLGHLYSLSTIFVESKYQAVAQQRGVAGTGQQAAS